MVKEEEDTSHQTKKNISNINHCTIVRKGKMVSVRLVDRPDSPEERPVGSIPEMMFAVGEEPVGVRVLTYLSSGAINRIYKALDEDEVEIIRGSAFGKILEIVNKPVFSGRFARYILSRQLKTKKKHEAWFRFAGKPIRFSLREFAIVTGLPCGKYPLKSKMKLKATIAEKPYWPSLFGKMDVATVASVIRMLRKHTVEDRIVRIKYACLAILSSVLLPTNVKMKICREHVEAIEDLEDFFSYPWGRLAFDMLMTSIKERDEIALSQNTIAVKGFALALQLVMVEAVPCLNEVIQESCSSSEGDSEDDVDDKSAKPRRKTLSPAHARNIDKRSDVLVRSINDEDPLRPIDESQLVWSDEEDDEKVDEMVVLINNNFVFTKSMFVGGVTKVDVDRMRESENLSSKLKKPKIQPPLNMSNDPSYIASLVIENVRPEFVAMEGTILRACKRVDSVEGSIVGLVEGVLAKFKDEILHSVRCLVGQLTKDNEGGPSTIPEKGRNTAAMDKGNMRGSNVSPLIDVNGEIIRNILDNLSAYSTPPASPRLSLGENPSPTKNHERIDHPAAVDNVHNSFALSAHSENHRRSLDLNQPLEVENRFPITNMEVPSFSLGLTQEEPLEVAAGNTVNVVDNTEDPQQSRKSKRQKCVPQALVDDYECGREIVSRVRKSQKFIFAFDDRTEIDRHYGRLVKQVKRDVLIKVGGVSVSAKDILLIAERKRHLTSKVVDILIRLLEFSIQQNFHPDFSERAVYLDSRYTAGVGRSYPSFCKSRKKISFVFPRGLVEEFEEENVSNVQSRRYYFPINVSRKHWVGLCVDPLNRKITVLDSNTSLFSDSMMEKNLHSHFLMLPYLLRLAGHALHGDESQRLQFERPKGLSQTDHPFASGLMSVLLMGTHAVHGIEACKNINSNILAEEGKAAAIMAFELNENL
ncbi:uncharacterized protein LOC108808979 [Raphanus sativus]|uniref:Uncharacterized protein LOC108808979 n=1 Tax=Raphanus sativus TaxID=3726 RepID=A0A6J0JLX1_RAPSA|nr:uncharacterized protein LOC108808979 [Raphanus sativus]